MEELMLNISELRKEIKQCITAGDKRLEEIERRINAYTYLSGSKQEKALDVLDTAIIVLSGASVVMVGMALIALMR